MRFRTERGLFDHDSATHQGIKPYKVCVFWLSVRNSSNHFSVPSVAWDSRISGSWKRIRLCIPITRNVFISFLHYLFWQNLTHDKKPFTCSICSKGFRTKFNLQRHEKTHRKKGSIKTESKNASPTSSSCSVTASLSPINQRINEERPVVDIAAIENSVVVDDHEVIKIERDDHSECR